MSSAGVRTSRKLARRLLQGDTVREVTGLRSEDDQLKQLVAELCAQKKFAWHGIKIARNMQYRLAEKQEYCISESGVYRILKSY